MSLLAIVPTAILLGNSFGYWIVDYGILWRRPLQPGALAAAEGFYASMQHMPAFLQHANMALGGLAVVALLAKLLLGTTSNILFDGASLLLYFAVLGTMATTMPDKAEALHAAAPNSHQSLDILRELASAHLLVSVALTGVISLQAFQYLAKYQARKDSAIDAKVEADSVKRSPTKSRTPSSLRKTPKRSTPSTPFDSPTKPVFDTPAPSNLTPAQATPAEPERRATRSTTAAKKEAVASPVKDNVVVEIPVTASPKKNKRKKV